MAAAKKKQTAKSSSAKTTKSKATKTKAAAKAKTQAKKAKPTTKSSKKPTTSKSTTRSKKTTTSKKSSPRSSKTATPKVADFLSEVIKQCTKAQKAAQTQTKTLAKQLTALDKEQGQLTKKQTTAKGKTWQGLEAKLAKLKTQSAVVRTALLNSENSEDKIATLAEFAANLNSRATPSSYLPTRLSTPSKPTLVKSNPKSGRGATAAKNAKAQPQHEDYLDEDDYPDEEDLDLDDDNEEMGFVFGDEEEHDDEMLR